MSDIPRFTLADVAKHNTEEDCWIIVDSEVYDVTKFLKVHPGGRGPLLSLAGKDATLQFFEFHKKNILDKYPKLRVGKILNAEPQRPLSTGLIDDVTPFAETTADLNWKSPFFKPSHLKFRRALRDFYDREIRPQAEAEEESGRDPTLEVFQKLGRAGIWACRIGIVAMPFVKPLGITLPSGLSPDEFDYFHEQIAHSENQQYGCPGYADGLGSGLCIGLPPVIHFGPADMRNKVGAEVLLGDKRICLAISEAGAGSDVAALATTAKLSDDGKHYIVNGHKKWITNGSFSDYFVTAVRTGGAGARGLSLLLIERSDGLTTQKMKTSYSPAAGTALVMYENVKVPRSNLLGKENDGFRCIVYNFNHERWMIALSVVPIMRLVLADCYRWAMNRKVFGKRLIEQPVIRFKLAQMTAGVESSQAWLDAITFQMNAMSYKESNEALAGPIALLKYHITRNLLMVCDNGAQIFGGRAITRTGMGQNLERIMKGAKIVAIYGGSEEIMADLAVRQALSQVDARIAKNPALAYIAKL